MRGRRSSRDLISCPEQIDEPGRCGAADRRWTRSIGDNRAVGQHQRRCVITDPKTDHSTAPVRLSRSQAVATVLASTVRRLLDGLIPGTVEQPHVVGTGGDVERPMPVSFARNRPSPEPGNRYFPQSQRGRQEAAIVGFSKLLAIGRRQCPPPFPAVTKATSSLFLRPPPGCRAPAPPDPATTGDGRRHRNAVTRWSVDGTIGVRPSAMNDGRRKTGPT